MRKKEWGKPKLITLVRLKGERAVLENCKTAGQPGSSEIYGSCYLSAGTLYIPEYTVNYSFPYTVEYSCPEHGQFYNFGNGQYSSSYVCVGVGEAYDTLYGSESTVYTDCMGGCDFNGS